jgi:hypothetical protein
MLSSQDLATITDSVGSVLNLTVDIQQKSTGDAWNTVLAGVPAFIGQFNDQQAMNGEYQYGTRIDAAMRIAYSDLIKKGMKVIVRTVNGAAATPGQAKTYTIITTDDILSFGVFLECKLTLWK